MRFELLTPARVIFGAGALKEVGPLAPSYGRRALVVVGSSLEYAAPLMAMLAENGVAGQAFTVTGEPTTDKVEAGMALARKITCDVVIGFGGGSAIDTAKAISALLANGGELLDYLEVIGRGRALSLPAVPCIAIPTTAGTGAEVTRNAVLASPTHRVKVSLRSQGMAPRLAVVDPELTYSLPPAVTASTGLDALTQVIEPFVSIRANPVTDALCREAMGRAARSLRRVYANGQDYASREDMAIVSLFGGLALANAGLGTVHGFASVLGGMLHAPHGAICARLLPYTVAVNIQALKSRQPQSEALLRYDQIAQILTGEPTARAVDGVKWLIDLGEDLQVPPLAAYGLSRADLPAVIEKTLVASSTKANPVVLLAGELQQVLEQTL